EIPDPNCIGPGRPIADVLAPTRAPIEGKSTATEDFDSVNVTVQMNCVGFFDYQEGQEGIAPNAIELHPIIDITFNPYFTISSSVQSMTIARGGVGTSTITSTLSGNFNSTVNLSATGLPSGATANFSPASFGAPGNGISTLTITTAIST